MSEDASAKLISPSAVLQQVAAAIPEDFRHNIIIVGSLAAGYYFFADNPKLQVRTKDVQQLAQTCSASWAWPAATLAA